MLTRAERAIVQYGAMDSESTLECCSADLTDTIVANLRPCYSLSLSHEWLPFACVLQIARSER